ncbi:putative serine carboxypeptidase-like 19-like [Capsicum annuum]|nr:putative serine carboxypeptidase-like 19-like [Capsicum annuum]
MEPEALNAQTMDNNAINLILACLETMSRDVARLNMGLEKLDTDVALMGGRLERVKSQKNRLSTPQNISPTITPKALHQMNKSPSQPPNVPQNRITWVLWGYGDAYLREEEERGRQGDLGREVRGGNQTRELAIQQNLIPIKINVDSGEVIHVLSKGNPLYDSLIDDCRLLIRRLGRPTVQHCFKEQSKVDDALAKNSATQLFVGKSQVFAAPPSFIVKEVWNDISRSVYQRSVPISLNIHRREVPIFVIAAGSLVKFLPGFQGPLPFALETGYVGVGDVEDVQLFYYFIKSESNPESDPVLLWITGGPGCSALSGLIYEIGPITFEPVEYNGSFPTMILNPYSWTKAASIIFLDFPVGTGFSYAATPAAQQSSDLKSSDHAYQFLHKWFIHHPEFLRNPLYVAGDSYSGMFVPIITQIIAIKNDMEIKPFINLKGYLLGNPLTFKGEDNYEIPYAHGMGLISDEFYELLKGINEPHILEPKCEFVSPKPHLLFGQRRSLDEKFHQLKNPEQLPALKCRNDWYKHSYHWADDGQDRDALNIRKDTVGKWERCASNLKYQKTVMSTIPYHASLSSKGYRSLIYSGDHDKVVSFQSTQAWIKSLNYSIVDDWRTWTVDNQVAGEQGILHQNISLANVWPCSQGGYHTSPCNQQMC